MRISDWSSDVCSSDLVNLASLEANLDLGFATLTSSTSRYNHEGDITSENTGFYAQTGWLGFYYNYPRPMASAVRKYGEKAVTQELRLTSNDDGGRFDYVLSSEEHTSGLQSLIRTSYHVFCLKTTHDY